MNQYWPKLELTKEELDYCRAYDGEYPVKDDQGNTVWKRFPGVMRRTYKNQLIATNFVNETSVFQQNFSPSGRRVRVFAFTFSGFIANWQIKLFSTSGELWVQDFTTVTALLNTASRQGSAFAPETQVMDATFVLAQQGGIPYRRDPNILLEGTQELVFQAQIITPLSGNVPNRFVLNIATHVWEFPDMPRADGSASRTDTAFGMESMGATMARKRGL